MKVTDETGGKYYATKLRVELDDGRVVHLELSSDDLEPSQQELEEWGGSRQDFFTEVSDGHYEREATRLLADFIVGAAETVRYL